MQTIINLVFKIIFHSRAARDLDKINIYQVVRISLATRQLVIKLKNRFNASYLNFKYSNLNSTTLINSALIVRQNNLFKYRHIVVKYIPLKSYFRYS